MNTLNTLAEMMVVLIAAISYLIIVLRFVRDRLPISADNREHDVTTGLLYAAVTFSFAIIVLSVLPSVHTAIGLLPQDRSDFWRELLLFVGPLLFIILVSHALIGGLSVVVFRTLWKERLPLKLILDNGNFLPSLIILILALGLSLVASVELSQVAESLIPYPEVPIFR
jgi:hypothetical protein